jgi:FAD/FMN-containing dehydrogenase
MKPVNGSQFTYIDAILALLPLAKFHPAETLDEIEWVDERPQPTNEEVLAKLEELGTFNEGLERLRQERNKKLAETDWVSGTDVPQELKDVWNPYRQELRDITSVHDSDDGVIWPTPPA